MRRICSRWCLHYSRNNNSRRRYIFSDRANSELIQHVLVENSERGNSFHSPSFLISAGLWWITTASFQSPRARRVSWVFVGRDEAAKEEAEPGEDSWAVGRDRRTAIERLRVGGRVERVEGEWLRVMPPLGRALIGLWASEAYSFHPVSTSRFPSILFHNTPRDVYVLQDARKMRSRLHSDIGRFTARWGKRMGSELKEENDAAQQSLRKRSSWDLRGRASRLLFALAIHRILRTERRRSRACVHIVYLRPEISSRSSMGYYSVKNWTLRTYLEKKEEQIIRKLLDSEYWVS